MPNINLRDGRNRDALVRAETVKQANLVRYVDAGGTPARLRKVLKATVAQDHAALLKAHGDDPAALAAALIAGDPDTDIERAGMFLDRPARVWVNDANAIVYRIIETEIVHNPDGSEKDRRPRQLREPNIESEFPISWTGRKVSKADAVRRFVFSSKLQIVHANGLTYDFLYQMAKELAETQSLMLLGAGKTGKEPLVFRRGGNQFRAFLEGRIDGPRYVLLMHLSNLELKLPEPVVQAVANDAAAAEVASNAPAPEATPAAGEPLAAKAAATEEPVRHKPTAQDVIALSGSAAGAVAGAKDELKDTVAAARSAKRRKTKAVIGADDTAKDEAAAGDDAGAGKAARKSGRKTATKSSGKSAGP